MRSVELRVIGGLALGAVSAMSLATPSDRPQRPTASSYYVQNFGPYLNRHITTSLINRGQARYAAHWGNLSRIQSTYGVDPSVIMAIYGKETSYGAVTG